MSQCVLHVVGARPNFMKMAPLDGTNKLVGSNPDVLPGEVDAVLSGHGRRGKAPELWDGKAGERAAEAIRSLLS